MTTKEEILLRLETVRRTARASVITAEETRAFHARMDRAERRKKQIARRAMLRALDGAA